MSNIVVVFLKYTWMVIVRKDGTRKFNVYNPIGYVALLLFSFVSAVYYFFVSFVHTFVGTIKDSVEHVSEYVIVALTFWMFVASIIYFLCW